MKVQPVFNGLSRWFWVSLVMLALVLPASSAAAQDDVDTDALRGLIADATKLAYEEKYDEAILKYIEAKTILDDPLLDYNIARCYHKKGDCPSATRFYKTVVENPATAEEDRKAAEGYLAELGECKTEPAGPGPGDVVAVGPGDGTEGNGDTGKGGGEGDSDTQTVGSDGGGSAYTYVAWGATLTGGALILTGLALDVTAGSLIDDYEAAALAGNQAEFDALRDDIDSRRTTIFALYGVGAAAAIAGGIMLVLDDDGDKDAPAVGAAPFWTPDGGAGAMIEGRW